MLLLYRCVAFLASSSASIGAGAVAPSASCIAAIARPSRHGLQSTSMNHVPFILLCRLFICGCLVKGDEGGGERTLRNWQPNFALPGLTESFKPTTIHPPRQELLQAALSARHLQMTKKHDRKAVVKHDCAETETGPGASWRRRPQRLRRQSTQRILVCHAPKSHHERERRRNELDNDGELRSELNPFLY